MSVEITQWQMVCGGIGIGPICTESECWMLGNGAPDGPSPKAGSAVVATTMEPTSPARVSIPVMSVPLLGSCEGSL